MKEAILKLIHEIMEDAARCKHCQRVLRDYGLSVARVAVQLGILTDADYGELMVLYT